MSSSSSKNSKNYYDIQSKIRKKYLCCLWSIWFNHELAGPHHIDLLNFGLRNLLRMTSNGLENFRNRYKFSRIVNIFDTNTLNQCKKVWNIWLKNLSGQGNTSNGERESSTPTVMTPSKVWLGVNFFQHFVHHFL